MATIPESSSHDGQNILIEGQAGQVGVDSARDHGSTFWFTLPLAEPPTEDFTTEPE